MIGPEKKHKRERKRVSGGQIRDRQKKHGVRPHYHKKKTLDSPETGEANGKKKEGSEGEFKTARGRIQKSKGAEPIALQGKKRPAILSKKKHRCKGKRNREGKATKKKHNR